MALSPWTISRTDKTGASAKINKASAVNSGASFAAVMAKENQKQGSLQVARLPEAGLPLRSATLAGRTPNEMLRAQNFSKASSDITQTRNMDAMMQSFTGNATTLNMARGLNAAKNLRVIAAANQGKGFELNASDFIHTRNNVSRVAGTRRKSRIADTAGIGRLSARFESGGDGIAAIGYDSTGGTSYGKFQIASKVGSMKNFLSYLDKEAPDLSARLRKAGPANTGSRRGSMPNEWRAIAKEQPERFERLQEGFIHETHYKPALNAIEKSTGINGTTLSPTMREVIWSTAVQHGPNGAARIFARADDLSGKATEASYERKLINNVYNLRAGQFGSSSRQVREAVQNRFRQEKQLALNMLEGNTRANRA